ncbi:MAG: hypothetical protein PW788_04670 [Micavibrio sp.]|nr:hypothetical protein [Micavibrio sp.]
MKNIQQIVSRADIHDHMKSLWRTDAFKDSYARGGLVYRIVDRFAALPRFFYDMSDEYLERAHFSLWWSGIGYRQYDKGSCNDLYLLHELAHGADMIHLEGQHPDSFARKMQDNELYASTVTEIMVYFDMPELRAMTFPTEIFADRFLKDGGLQQRWQEEPDRLTTELYYRRRHAMFWPKEGDAIEQWLHSFTAQNQRWFDIWRQNYDSVETAMARLTRAAFTGDRKGALQRHLDWLHEKAGGGDIPFRAEAAAFAPAYWQNRNPAIEKKVAAA